MAKTRDILGHATVETATNKRKCHHSRGKHGIAAGSTHLAIKESSFRNRKNYCVECAKPILDMAGARLRDLHGALGLPLGG